MPEQQVTYPILFFDGVCNLCNASIQFVIRHDKKEQFRFAPLQSPAGIDAVVNLKNTTLGPGTVILFYKGKYYTRSAAALHTLRLLDGWYKLFYAGIIIPRFIRDAVYDLISKNRYKWFGKKNVCMVPTPALEKRFISN